MPRFLRQFLVASAVFISLTFSESTNTETTRAETPSTEPPSGLRDHTPEIHALKNARIVASPGHVLEKGIVILRDGIISSVAIEASIPPDARVWDLEGMTIYPGLIDAYSEVAVDSSNGLQTGYWNSQITPQSQVADHYKPDQGLNEKLRAQGITARLVAPSAGIIKGQSCVVLTSDRPPSRAILKRDAAQHLRLTVSPGRSREQYPASPMGALALARQAMYDAQWYAQAQSAAQADRSLPRPEQNDALVALQSASQGGLFIADAPSELYFLRADQFGKEFSLNVAVRGSGREYRQLDAIVASKRSVIVPLDFPRPPFVDSAESTVNAKLEDLLHWDNGPENAARLDHAGVRIALTTHGLSEPSKFLPAVRKVVKRGLSTEAALRAMTVAPAELLGVADRIGTIEVGKIANLLVTRGDLFEDKSVVVETWIDGHRFDVSKAPKPDVRGKWLATIELDAGKRISFVVTIEGLPTDLSGNARLDAPDGKKHEDSNGDKDDGDKDDDDKDDDDKDSDDKDSDDKDSDDKDSDDDEDADDEKKAGEDKKESKLEKLKARDGRLSFSFDAKPLVEQEGRAQVTVLVSAPEDAVPSWQGQITLPSAKRLELNATRIEPPKSGGEKESASDTKENDKKEKDDKEEKDKDEKKNLPASYAVNFPLGPFGRTAAPEQPKAVVFKNATVWTSGPAGILENASVLIGEGKVLAVGTNIEIPADAQIIDVTGKHISPGIIDCHSHMATDGGINEATQAVTAEVRISDFLDSNDIDIYRQLAGGVTTSNILHGSANPIGGQNQVIKLRWGATPEELKFVEAPAGIKFALGENVKQANWGDEFRSRYPQTRMGVEQIMIDEFSAARDYLERWDEWKRTQAGMPPRRDLELEAIGEILEKKRWIHCHSYRQDEILALLRTLDGFGIQIGTLQHILEGYKVADEMARHGAMGSSFSDWWGYKFEVFDSIPYNGALMHNAGIVVSFNSDDQELARHLNHEAAKAVKYGGVPPAEALKFVTANPARQLRIDSYVGSLEPGKHADLVVWSGSPLSVMARCEQTWVDGRRYFSLEEDRALREEILTRKSALVQKVLASGESMRPLEENDANSLDLWPRADEFCHPHFRF